MAKATLISHDNASRRLRIDWSDGQRSEFPYIWLRHALFFPATGRPGQAGDGECLEIEDPGVCAIADISRSGESLAIGWSHDGSKTTHDIGMLRASCPSRNGRHGRRLDAVLWDGAQATRLPRFGLGEIEAPERRLALLRQVRDYGFAIMEGVPVEPGAVVPLARHFGPIRVTHYGTLFDVRSKPEDQVGTRANVGAVKANAQAPHTDEAWRQLVPGISFFHCLKPDPGGKGASIYIDGFAAAERLRRKDPQAFSFLASTPLMFAATRNPHERFRARGRMIATDEDGIVRGIRLSDRTLPPLDLAVDLIEPAYRAIAAFRREAYDYAFAFEKVLQAGECAVFDNHRILHARRSFDGSAGERWLQQVSVDRDEFHNTLQCLALTLGHGDEAGIEQDNGALTQAGREASAAA